MENKQKAIILIGVPLSGKSTYRNQLDQENHFVISRDDIREDLIEQYGIPYQDLYTKPKEGDPQTHPLFGQQVNGQWSKIAQMNDELQQRFKQRVVASTKEVFEGKNIVVDLTNLTQKERAEYINLYKELGVEEIEAVVFQFEGNEDKIFEMNKIRGNQKGNIIPEAVITNMMKSLEYPSESEGFTAIRKINTYANFSPNNVVESKNKEESDKPNRAQKIK